jgi:hypothetical protein
LNKDKEGENLEERPIEEVLQIKPRGTELSDMVEEYYDSQKKRISYQLKILSRGKNELKRKIKDPEVLKIVLAFEDALRKKESFEKAFTEAINQLRALNMKKEDVPYFVLIEMIKSRPFQKVIEYLKTQLEEEGKWSKWSEEMYYRYRKQEDSILKTLKEVVEPWPVWQEWLQFVKGIDLPMAAQIKGGFETALGPGETIGSHFRNPSQMRQFAGLGDPQKSKRVKGEKLHCNLRLKATLLGRLAPCFLRQVDRRTGKSKSGYRDLYLKFKEEEIRKCQAKGIRIVPAAKLPEKDGKKYEPPGLISEGHIHQRALRKMMQIFINHLWEISRRIEGLPAGPESSYAFAKLKHPISSYIPPIMDVERIEEEEEEE